MLSGNSLRSLSLCFLTLFMVLAPATAQTQPNSTLEQQRERYIELKNRIRTVSASRLSGLVDEVQAMQDYPLFPYLYYDLVSRRINYANRAQIRAFLRDTQGLPIRNQMLRKWLRYLAKNHYQTAFLQEYEPGFGTELLCNQLHFKRRKQGTDPAWYEQAQVIWLAGFSQPEACDPVLYHWREQGMLTPELAIQRIGLAGEAGKTSLTRYLKRYAPEDAKYLADLWLQVHRNSSSALSPGKYPFRYPQQEPEIAKTGLVKASWSRPERVIQALPKWQVARKLPAEELQEITQTLAISLTLDEHDAAKYWLESASTEKADQSLWRWHLAHYLKQQDWDSALGVINQSPQSIKQSNEFRYWQARALEQVGQVEAANAIRKVLAKERHYYAFMASAQVGTQPTINNQPVSVDEQVLDEVTNNDYTQRARELFFHGEYVHARREWWALNRQLNDQQKRAAIMLASQWGWHDQAIIGVLRTGDNNDLQRRFPLAYQQSLENRSQQYDITPAFAMAITRRESSFMVDAVSTAGARGLMQLMPNTATYLVKNTNVLSSATQRRLAKGSIKWKLFDVDTNLDLGVGYLRYLHDKLNNNPILVAAAYNAGWQKVYDWLPQQTNVPIDVWVDTIPFKETRDYVKAVMAYQVIYEWQLGQQSHLFKDLNTMTTPVLQR